ncbi:MAG: hypothetical protein IJ682_01120 [Lachnospiraceae bacterium]|nr:hypothetical protein [Lachnospiraceae bacterium]
MLIDDRQAMSAAYKAQIEKLGIPISAGRYRELREYADENRIRISGFRNFVGDIETIKKILDDIYEIGQDFPKILDERAGVVLELDYDMDDEDFATTDSGHIIRLNASYFSDVNKMSAEYERLANEKHFVYGSDWRAIGRHEAGHVVANVYSIEPLDIAFGIKNTTRKVELFEFLKRDLSLYSTAYEDGREIISESFSCYYSKIDNLFVKEFVQACMDISGKDR